MQIETPDAISGNKLGTSITSGKHLSIRQNKLFRLGDSNSQPLVLGV